MEKHTYYKKPTRRIHFLSGLAGLLLLAPAQTGLGQTTIGIQDFETSPATPTITYATVNTGTPGTGTGVASGNTGSGDSPASSPQYTGGARGYRVAGPSSGTSDTGRSFTFSVVDASAYTGINVSFRVASMSIGSGSNGIESDDYVRIDVSPDGGTTWWQQARLQGSASSQSRWAFSGTGSGSRAYVANNSLTTYTPGGSGGLLTGANAITTITITGLPQVSNLRIRISTINDSANESWMLDDVRITGTLVQNNVWDGNGATADSGNVGGSWSESKWSSSTAGTAATGAFTSGLTPTFSAGTDGVGTWAVNVNAVVSAAGLAFEEGNVTLAADTGTLTLSAPTVSVASGATGTISEPVLGSAGLTKAGNGTLTLTGLNTFTGGVTVNGGLMEVQDPTDGASFDHLASQAVSIASGIFRFNNTGGNLNTFSGAISGAGMVEKTGVGRLSLSGNNNAFTGTVLANGGDLDCRTGNAIGDSSQVIVNAPGKLTVVLAVDETVGTIQGDGTLDFYGAGNPRLILSGNADRTFSGTISGNGGPADDSGALVKQGSGTLTLTGDNGFTKGVRVNAGMLLVNNTVGTSATGDGDTKVQTGAALGGTGQTGGGLSILTVDAGGTLAPGNGSGNVGTLTVGNDATINGTLQIEYSGANADRVNVGDQLTLGAGSVLSFSQIAALTQPSYVIAQYVGRSGTFGTVNNLPAGYALNYGATQITLFQTTADVALSDNAPQVAQGTVAQGSASHVLHTFQLGVSSFAGVLNAVAVTTAGHDADDLINLKLWLSADAIFDGGDTLVATLAAPGAAGVKSFSGLSQGLSVGTHYFFVTADLAADATAGNSVGVGAIATADLTFASANKTGGPTTAGGARWIVAPGFSLVEDFQSLSVGLLNGQGGWSATSTSGDVGIDPVDGANKVADLNPANERAYKAIPNIHQGGSGTLFMRFRLDNIDGVAGATSESAGYLGLSDLTAPDAFTAFEAQWGVDPQFTTPFGSRHPTLANFDQQLSPDVWYSVWTVPNNQSDTFTMHIQGGAFATQTQLTSGSGTVTDFGFRNGTANNPLQTVFLRAGAVNAAAIYVDDLYMDNSGQNLTLPIAASAASDIVRDTGFTEPVSLPYLSYQSADITDANSLELARFTIRDGGALGDGDPLATTLSAISFTVQNGANLRRVALYDGATEIAEVAGGATVSFGGLTGLAASDDTTKTFSIRATFNAAVTDNAQIRFSVSSATAHAAGSTFAAADAGGAQSDVSGDANRIEVTATKLVPSGTPSIVPVAQDFALTVQALDALDNLDLDSAASVTLTKASGVGTLSSSAGLTQALAAGVLAWNDLRFNLPGAFTITADDGGPLADATSGAIQALTVLDSFTDGNFAANPVWSGDTARWGVQANSDAAAGATGSQTLRLNGQAVAETDHLRTQIADWGDRQEWGFWIGRRAQAFTAANQAYFWLYANEANLESGTVDGYRLAIGDDSGGDEIRLERILNGGATTILTSVGALSTGLTDIGFLVRVTRSPAGVWTLYSSTLPTVNGTGAIATDLPTAANTPVNQGSVTDATYTPAANGYLGIAALHTSGANPQSSTEFDQICLAVGPALTAPGLTPAGGATVDAAFAVTFADDPDWRATITGITVDGTALTAGYAVSAGQILFTPADSVPAGLIQTAHAGKVIAVQAAYYYAVPSATQSLGAGAPTQLAVTTQPTAPAANGGALAQQPVVQVRDQYGNLTASTAEVTAAPVQATWTLGGTLSQNAVSGVATFSGLTASSYAAVSGATIAFSSPGLTGVTSSGFNIPAPPAYIWDNNGATSGSGNSGGNWSDAKWSADPDGAVATYNFAANQVATFSAGTDGIGTFSVTVNSGSISVGGLSFQEGNVTVAAGSGSLTLTGPTVTVASGATGTISEPILGSVGLTKTGVGTLTVSGASTYTGATSVDEGSLQLGAANVLPNGSQLVLNGGTFRTGATVGYAETMGTLNLAASSAIALGTGAHTLTFAASGAVTWNGAALTVTGWTGAAAATGTGGKIFVGSNASGLTADQLAKISFTGYAGTAMILATGEIVPQDVAPTLTTPTATDITTTSATLGANLTSDKGFPPISARGTVYGTTAAPTGNDLAAAGTDLGVFSHERTGLTANTLYTYRGYADNTMGRGYSPDGTFTTLPLAPTVGAGSGASGVGFTANWSHPVMGAAAYTYTVEVDDDPAFGSVNATVSSIASANTSQFVGGLEQLTTFYYRVKAVNAQGGSAWSAASAGIATLSYAISIPNTSPVTENFDAVSTTSPWQLPTGWKMSGPAEGASAGWNSPNNVAAAQTSVDVNTVPTPGRVVWQSQATTERSIGFYTSAGYNTPNAVMARYQNNTGDKITALTVSYNGERRITRSDSTAFNGTTFVFFYSTDGVTWTPVTLMDTGGWNSFFSSAVAGSSSVDGATKTARLAGLSLADGDSIYIKWQINTFENSVHWGFGLDNVSVTASTGDTASLGADGIVEAFSAMGTGGTAAMPTGFHAVGGNGGAITAVSQAAGTTGTGALTSTSTGGTYNFGNGVTANSIDRALGFLTSGTYPAAANLGSGPVHLVYGFKNDTGATVTSLDLAWNYEKSRSGTRAYAWTFFHGASVHALTAAAAGDQSYAADANNTTILNPPTATAKTVQLTGLNIPAGGIHYLRWTLTGNGGYDNGQGLGLDDLKIAAGDTFLSHWPLTVATSGSGVSTLHAPASVGLVTGGNAAYAGVATVNANHYQYGMNANGWGAARDTAKYFEYSLTAPANRELNVSSARFHRSTGGSSAVNFALYYSTDNFATATQIGADGTTSSTTFEQSSYTPSITVGTGQTVKFRLYAWAAASTYYLNVRDFTVSGLALPTIAVAPSVLDGALTATYGTPSAARSFTVSGAGLLGDLTVTAPSGLEVSITEGSGYAAVLALSPTLREVADTTVFVRLAAGAPVAGSYDGVAVTLSSDDATARTVTTTVTGNSVTPKELTITGLTGADKTYDGTTAATASGTAVLAGVVGLDDVSLAGTPVYTFADANAAPNVAISVSGYSLDGVAAGNYALTVPTTLTATIHKAMPTVNTVPTASDITYGQALIDSTLSGGAASVPGNFAFTSPATTPNAGTASQSVIFTPDDTVNYTTLTLMVDVTVLSPTPSVTLADNGAQIGEGTVVRGTASHVLHTFRFTVADASATLNSLAVTTAGTHDAGDLDNLKLWYSTDATFGGDTAIGTLAAPGAASVKSFTGLSQALSIGDHFFFVTADVAAAATLGNDVGVNAIANADVTLAGGNKSGSTTAGGARHIVKTGFMLVDDFETKTPGALEGQSGWVAVGHVNANSASAVEADPANAANQVAKLVTDNSANGGGICSWYKPLSVGQRIANGATGTFFLRVRAGIGGVAGPAYWFGLSGSAAPSDNGWWDTRDNQYEAEFNLWSNPMQVRVYDVALEPAAPPYTATGTTVGNDVWVNCWLVVDNATDTFDLYTSTGGNSAAQIANDVAFHNGTTDPMRSFLVFLQSGLANAYIDDLYVDIGAENTELPFELTDNGTQIIEANVARGTAAHVLYSFRLAMEIAGRSLMALDVTTTGSYDADDVMTLKLWYSTDSTFGGDAVIGTIAPSTAGAQSFTGLSQELAVGNSYFFITADIAADATTPNTMGVAAVGPSDMTLSAGTVASALTTADGAQIVKQPLTPGNLVTVLIDGNGAVPSTEAGIVRVNEYTTGGAIVNSLVMPYAGEGPKLTLTGTAFLEGKLGVSPNGRYVAVYGYDAAENTVSPGSTPNRTIARIGVADAAFDLSTTGPLGGTSAARAAMVDNTGTRFWIATQARGLDYVGLGQTTAGTLLNAANNVRAARIFGRQLYEYSDAAGNDGIYQVGTGLPTTDGQIYAGLPGLNGDSNLDIAGLFMADLSPSVAGHDTIYTARRALGVSKYAKVGTNWVLVGTDSSVDAVHLDGVANGGAVTLYIVEGNTAGLSRIMKRTDSAGYNVAMSGSFTGIVGDGANQIFRGVAAIPVVTSTGTLFKFK